MFTALNVIYSYTQKPISLNEGKGYDGVYYCRMAEDYALGRTPDTTAIYVYRVGTPFLVGKLFPGDILKGFFLVNLAANIFSVSLLVVWLRQFISGAFVRFLMYLMFMTHWCGPVRFTHYYPALSDPWAYVWLISGLILIHRTRGVGSAWPVLALSLLAFVAVLFREFLIVLPISFLFAENPLFRRKCEESWFAYLLREMWAAIPRHWTSYLPLLAAALGIVLTHLIVAPPDRFPFLQRASYAYTKPLQAWLLALFVVMGPCVVLLVSGRRIVADFLVKNQDVMACGLVISLLALIGGSDTERFWFWATPVFYVLLGRVIEGSGRLLSSKALIAVLAIGQTLTLRLYWSTPDCHKGVWETHWPIPVLTPVGCRFPYLDLFTDFAPPGLGALMLVEYLLLAGVLLFWLDDRSRRLGLGGSAGSAGRV